MPLRDVQGGPQLNYVKDMCGRWSGSWDISGIREFGWGFAKRLKICFLKKLIDLVNNIDILTLEEKKKKSV